jgi:hypothetical protein
VFTYIVKKFNSGANNSIRRMVTPFFCFKCYYNYNLTCQVLRNSIEQFFLPMSVWKLPKTSQVSSNFSCPFIDLGVRLFIVCFVALWNNLWILSIKEIFRLKNAHQCLYICIKAVKYENSETFKYWEKSGTPWVSNIGQPLQSYGEWLSTEI